MSQAGILNVNGGILPPTVALSYVTNSGTAVPSAYVLNILGGGETTTSGAGNTITVTAPEPVYNTDAGTATAINGTVNIIGAGGTTTSGSGNTIVVNAGGGGVGGASTFVTDSGVAIEVAGVLNDLGSGSITTSGAGLTVTTSLTGLTNHNVLVGAGTSTITKVPPSVTSGIALISQGAAADPLFGTVVVAGGGTGATSFNVNGIIISGTTPTSPLSSLTLTNGQIVIGATGLPPSAGTITAGTGITVTNAANSITIGLDGNVVGQTITGTSGGALSPTAGNWNILTSTTSAGTTPITTPGAGSTLTITLQRSQAIAASDSTKVGLSNFDSNHFSVDGNGFVSLSSTGPGLTITGQSGGALSPTASNWNIFGASTAAGTSPVVTSGSGSTMTVNVQKSQAIASTTASKVGLAAFDSASFVVDANGFVTLAGSNFGQTITGNTGGALSPTAGNWNIVGGLGISTSGSVSTLTLNSKGGGFAWEDVTAATKTIAVQNGYLTDRVSGVTYTLPATAGIGDIFKIVGKLGLTTITPNANQQLLISSASGTVGVAGTAVGTNVGDCITFVCTTLGASTVWRASDFVGNWTLN